jgi:hypothetical protein
MSLSAESDEKVRVVGTGYVTRKVPCSHGGEYEVDWLLGCGNRLMMEAATSSETSVSMWMALRCRRQLCSGDITCVIASQLSVCLMHRTSWSGD